MCSWPFDCMGKKPTCLSEGAGEQLPSVTVEASAGRGWVGWIWGVQGCALGPGESKALSS